MSGLKHCDKSKSAVSRINFMHNPVLSYIPQELCTPYHNSGVYSWYNSGFYKWAHRRIPIILSYQYYGNLSTGINKLNPALIQSHDLAVTFQKIAWEENSSIPYSKQKILDSDEE